jgi:hypothetical protein
MIVPPPYSRVYAGFFAHQQLMHGKNFNCLLEMRSVDHPPVQLKHSGIGLGRKGVEDPPRMPDLERAWRERRVDDGNLIRMDGQLGAKSITPCGCP